jgi:periplasmic divalent cation tolerance protein
MRSLYIWQGARSETNEVGVLFKTDASLLTLATARLSEIHPYDTPAVLGWRVDTAPRATKDWLRSISRYGRPN